MSINISKHDDKVSIVDLNGRLDATTSNDIQQQLMQLIASGETHLVLNFAKLEYISSAGLRVLITTVKQLKAKQGKLFLCEIQPMILSILETSGFTKIFEIKETLDEAINSF